jgi:hypothetical protein
MLLIAALHVIKATGQLQTLATLNPKQQTRYSLNSTMSKLQSVMDAMVKRKMYNTKLGI